MSLNITAAEADARLMRIVKDSLLGTTKIIRAWPFIDATEADALIVALAAVTTVTNPQVDKQAYAGIYNATISRMDGEIDRSVTIIQTLTLTTPVTGLGFRTGTDCRWIETSTFYYSLSKEQVDALIVTLALTTQVDGTVKTFTPKRNAEDGTFDCVYIAKVRQQQNIAQYQSGDSAAATATTEETLGAPLGTELPITPHVAGQIKRRDVEKQEDCTFNVKLGIETAIDQTATSVEKDASKTTTIVLHTEAAAALAAPTPAAGTLSSRKNTPTQSGLVKTEQQDTVVTDQTATSYEKMAARTVASVLHTEVSSALEPAVPAAGTIVELQQVPTQSGMVRRVEKTTTVTDQTATNYRKDASKTVTTDTHTEGTALASPAAPAAGTIVERTNQPTDSGKVATANKTTTVIDQTATSYDRNADHAASIELHTEGDTVADPGAQTAGTIKSVTQSPTESGKVQSQVKTDTAIDQTQTSYVKDASKVVTVVEHTHTTAIAAPAAPVAGTIVQVENSPTTFGDVATKQSTTVMADQTVTSYDQRVDQGASIVRHTQAAAALADPGTPAAGTITVYKNTPTSSGKIDTQAETQTAHLVQTTKSWTDRYGTSYLSVGKNATEAQFDTALTAAALTNATNNGVSKSINSFGLIDYTISKIYTDGGSNFTTYLGTIAVTRDYVWEREMRSDPSVATYGYKFRWNKKYITDAIYSVSGYTNAWQHIDGSNSADQTAEGHAGVAISADSDSILPTFIGMSAGASVYHVIRHYRVFGNWSNGAASTGEDTRAI